MGCMFRPIFDPSADYLWSANMLNEYRKAFSRPDIYIVILVGFGVAILGLIEMSSGSSFTLRIDEYFSAYQATLALGGNIAELFAIFLLPLFAILPYADSYFVEKRSGVHIVSLARQGRFGYFMGKAFAVWVLAVIAILTPYILNQLFCMIAFPTKRVLDMNASDNIYCSDVSQEMATNPSMLLFLNHPLLRNMLHILYACYYGGGIALFAYALTLYIHKNRALALLLPLAIVYASIMVGNSLFGFNGILPLGIVFGTNYRILSFQPMLAAIAALYAGSIAAILFKCFGAKDIL